MGADVVDHERTAQWHAAPAVVDQGVEIGQPRGGPRGDGARGGRIDTDVRCALFGCEMTDARFQRGLHRPHQFVIRDGFRTARKTRIVIRLPPFASSGSISRARCMNEWQDTSMAFGKPSRELSVTRPCRSCFGANATGCSRKSSRFQRCARASNSICNCVSSTASGDIWVATHNCWSNGSTCARALGVPGRGQFGAMGVEGLGTCPGDAAFVRDAHDQSFLACRIAHGHFSFTYSPGASPSTL